ncbi:MAG: hypothetical protein LBU32_17720 [Clostridiales bacterium]|nr:hypothetical protein [Clostridiales bacterium]
MAQSAVSPALAAHPSSLSAVEADRYAMSLRSALQIITQNSTFILRLRKANLTAATVYAFTRSTPAGGLKFGEADALARAKSARVKELASRSVLYEQKAVARHLSCEEIR